VVKDSTYPGPSLVTKVQYSSPTILQQLQVTHPVEKRGNAQFLGFSSRRAHLLKENYSICREEEVLVAKTHWYLIIGPRVPFLAHFGEVFLGI
jgi:hypothetical protein